MKAEIRKAKMQDSRTINELVWGYAKDGLMLSRPIAYINPRIRDFFVCADNKGAVVGCVALKVWNGEWAEIIALAVHQDYKKMGIGLRLVSSCIADAEALGIKNVFILTFEHDLAIKSGFTKVDDISILPEIVFTEKTVNVDKAYTMNISDDKG